jgi:hypothetical protein
VGQLPPYVHGLPNISGSEALIDEAVAAGRRRPLSTADGAVRIGEIDSAFAIALHMHQPLIPAGGDDLRRARSSATSGG